MITIPKLKQEFIDGAALILQHKLSLATGGASGKSPLDITKCQQDLHENILSDLMEVIKASDLLVEVNWKDSTKSEKVDSILEMIGSGEITPNEGKRLISTVTVGLDVDLEEMLARLENIDLGKNV